MTSSRGRPRFPGRPHPFPPFFNGFFNPFPFFFSPFFVPTFNWWWYPPLTFSDFGCPYQDYYNQQPYYQPEEGMGEPGAEAEEPSQGPEEPGNVPPEQPQEQTAPFTYETPLPDVIEWGKASEAVPQGPGAPSGKEGPLVVNLPHHTLTILLNQADSLTAAPKPQPAPAQSH